MQRLGKVLHMSPSRNMIVKIENMPKIGEKIFDENLKPIGKIFDIFGPISSPYVAVKPVTQNVEKSANKMLYMFPSERRKEKIMHERLRKRS